MVEQRTKFKVIMLKDIKDFVPYVLPESHLGIKDKKCPHYSYKVSIWHQGTKTNTVLK